MAVTTTYSFDFVESIDPISITGRPDATSLSGGGVAVVGDHAGHTDITTFEPDGDVAGSASVIPGVDAAVTQLSDGNLVVLSDTGTDMSFRIVTTAGATVRVDTSIGESGADVLDPEVAALTGGGFVVAIQDFFAGTDNDVDIRVYDSAGNLLTNFAVDGTGANDQNPSVAGLADGGFAVAWHRNIGSENEMWYAVYNANGTVRQAPGLLDTTGTVNRNASVVALDNGGFAIAYEDNGWSTTDIDITLARFDAAGTFIDWDDITQNTSNDTGPSATVLSNGMIAVGYTNDIFGDTDTRITLVDQNTGAALTTSTVGGSFNNELEITIAAMNNGQVATFNTDATAGVVQGSIRQATRFSNSDAASDTILIDKLRDVASGNDGDDTFQGVGNNVFINDTIDGGSGSDRILATDDVSLVNTTLTSIEEIEFEAVAPAKTVVVRADQIGAGLASNLIVDFAAVGTPDVFRVSMLGANSVDLSQLQIQDFIDGPGEGDRLIILGDGDAETMRGTSVRDELRGNDGDDVLEGGGGGDLLVGSNGNDTASYLNALAGVIANLSASAGNTGDAAGDTYSSIENLRGSAFADTLTGKSGDNRISGGGGGDRILGLGGNDDLFGNDGDDILIGGAGADDLGGGAGIDTASYETAGAGVVANLNNPGGNTRDAAGDTYSAVENLTGSNFADTLTGKSGSNVLSGGGGGDRIFGLGGSDDLFGGAGNDILVGGAGADDLFGGAGSDTASYEDAAAGVVASLFNPGGNTGHAAGDTYSSIENLTGSAFADTLTGNTGANVLVGGNGADRLNGRQGNDTLTGGGGNDNFLFNTALGAGNVDAITDFNFVNDTIRLENAIFNAVVGVGTLTAAQFRSNNTGQAGDANDRIIYEIDTGNLFYDTNGNAAGGSVLFATLTAGLGISNADFFIV